MADENTATDGAGQGSQTLTTVFRSQAVVKIVETLLDADQPLSATEIADRAGTSRNAWYDNRDRLETAGLVENHGSAGYRIPPNSDAADAARDLRTAIEK